MYRQVFSRIVVGGLVLLLLVVSCAPAKPTPTPTPVPVVPTAVAKPIKIASAGGLTGARAYPGQGFCNAGKLAAEHLSAQGGVLGRPVEVVCIDDQDDPKQSVIVAHSIVDAGDYVAVSGHGSSGTTFPAQPIYMEARMPLMAKGSNPKIFESGFDNVFMDLPDDYAQGICSAEYCAQTGAKTVSITHNKSIFGERLAEIFRERIEKLGVKVLSFQGINPQDVDFTPTLSNIKAEHPDVYYHAGYIVESAPLAKQKKALGMDDIVFMTSDATSTEFVDATGDAGVGTISVTASPGYDYTPELSKFAEQTQARWGRPAEPWDHYFYDSVFLVADAIKRAGTTEHEAVLKALRESKYKGITMTYSFTPNGRLNTPTMWVFQLAPDRTWKRISTWSGTWQ